jgi:outer membrane protein OmpA-like peptidoglycan-associated protein
MRCRSSSLLGFLVVLGACTKTDLAAPCHPVTSWSMPAFRCSVAAPPPVVAVAPPPETPPPEPPKKATLKQDKIEVGEIVEFETGSAKLKPESTSILDEVAKILTEHADVKKVQIEGYTDSQGSKSSNKTLSQHRAETVKKYLVDKGISDKRLTTKGFGQDNPVADNGTDDGRHQNRRVEFKILERDAAQ